MQSRSEFNLWREAFGPIIAGTRSCAKIPAESKPSAVHAAQKWLAHAEDGVTLEATALADFEPEADVAMRLRRGETIALLQGVAPPDGWAVALRRVDAPTLPRCRRRR